ncbi:anti-sigma B factor antagonist [Shigella flexneri]
MTTLCWTWEGETLALKGATGSRYTAVVLGNARQQQMNAVDAKILGLSHGWIPPGWPCWFVWAGERPRMAPRLALSGVSANLQMPDVTLRC